MKGGWKHDAEGRGFDLRLLARIWPFVRPKAAPFGLGFALLMTASMIKLVPPYLIKLAIDGPMARGDVEGLGLYAGLLLIAGVAEAGLGAAQTLIVRITGQDVLCSIRSALFAKAQRLEARHYDTTPSGQTLSRITSDVSILSDLFSAGVLALIGDLFLLVSILVALYLLSPDLALTAYVAIPLVIIVAEFFRRKMRAAYRATRRRTAQLTGTLQGFLSGLPILRLFGAVEWAEEEFGAANAAHRDSFLRSVILYSLFFPVVELATSFTLALVLWKGGLSVTDSAITFGVLVAFIEYLQRFFRPVRDLSEKYNVLQASLVAIERISEFMALEEPTRGTSPAPALRGAVRFDGVHFGYLDETPVLHGIDLKLEPGGSLALVGPTGAGKSTLVHLLTGFYRPDAGAVTLDETVIDRIEPEDLRRQVALVAQDVFLFDGSVVDNICLGRDWVSEEAAIRAADAVGLGDAIGQLELGYNTPVLEGGGRLSSGQRQLVAFARALAGDPRVLVLDEATSEVDQATEAVIEQALETLFRDRTTLVVAHRLATVRRCDTVAVIHQGRVAEAGSHEGLLARSGLYRTLYELQFRSAGDKRDGEPGGEPWKTN
jgi:ATP-binding cassette subfamily B protein